MPDFNWTADAVGEIKRLWSEGFSYAEIARRLGGGLTRNAVCGKLNRMNGREGSDRKPKPKPQGRMLFSRAPFVPLPEPPPPVDEPESLRISLADIGPNMCRWIALDPLVDPSMCGHPAQGSLCPYHRSRAFQPLKPQKESA